VGQERDGGIAISFLPDARRRSKKRISRSERVLPLQVHHPKLAACRATAAGIRTGSRCIDGSDGDVVDNTTGRRERVRRLRVADRCELDVARHRGRADADLVAGDLIARRARVPHGSDALTVRDNRRRDQNESKQ